MPRKNIWVQVESMSYGELDHTSVKDMAERLLEIERRYPGCRMVDDTYPYDTSSYLSIQAERPETDEEMNKREILEARTEAENLAWKRRQLEALKKELGDTP